MKMKKETPFQLTASLEDYLEAIMFLSDADEHGHAHTRDIAKQLNVKMPSVTNALGILCRNGYINYDTNYPVTLTELGQQSAKRIMRRHQLLARFLKEILLLDNDYASEVACRMEHVATEDIMKRMETFIDVLQADATTFAALQAQMKALLSDEA